MSLSAEAICAGVAILVYVNTLGADFVYDDSRSILKNLDVRSSTPVYNILLNDFWGTPITHSGSHKSFRPLTTFTFRLNYTVSGFQPAAYHLANVLLHAMATWLFVSFLKQRILHETDMQRQKSLVAGLLFAVHPIHTEAVAGVVGRADILSGVFVLATLLSYAKYCDSCDLCASTEATQNHQPHASLTLNCSHKNGRILKCNRKQRWKNKHSRPELKNTDSKIQLVVNTRHCVQQTNVCGNSVEDCGENSRRYSRDSITLFYLPYAFAACALLSKENGICALPLCAVYDMLIRNQLGITSALRTILSLDDTARLDRVRRRVWGLTTATSLLVLLRILPWVIFSSKISTDITPTFSPSDNPASASDSFVARTLTFHYLIFFNVMLLICPAVLSYDWGAIPLVESVWDRRNISTTLFYLIVAVEVRNLWKCLRTRDENRFKFQSNDTTTSQVIPTTTCSQVSKLNSEIVPTQTKNRTEKRIEVVPAKALFNALINKAKCDIARPWDEGIHMDLTNSEIALEECGRLSESTSGVMDVKKSTNCFSTQKSNGIPASCEQTESTNSSGYATESGEEGRDERTMQHGRHIHENQDQKRLTAKPSDEGIVISNAVFMGLAMMTISFLPATNLFFYVGFVVAERLLYLPSMGYCILVADGWFAVLRKICSILRTDMEKQSISKVMNSIGLLFLCLLAIRTFVRNNDWKDELNLYKSGLTTSPAKSWANLGNVMKTRGQVNEAEICYLEALQHRANMADVHYNLGLLYQEQKRYAEALARYTIAIRYRPTLAVAHLNSGIVLAELGRLKEAEEMYRRTILLEDTGLRFPRSHARAKVSALYNLGCLLSAQERHDAAIKAFEEAIHRLTVDYEPHSLFNMLGQSLFKVNRTKEAEKWFKAALRAKPDHIPAHLTYALLLKRTGRSHTAEEMYKLALRIEPNNFLIYNHFAKLYSESGWHREAARLMEVAAKTEAGSSDYETIMAAGDTHRRLGLDRKAEEYYRAAVEINPKAEAARINLGAILHLRGKYEEARKSYQIALNLRPNDPTATKNLRKLDEASRKLD